MIERRPVGPLDAGARVRLVLAFLAAAVFVGFAVAAISNTDRSTIPVVSLMWGAGAGVLAGAGVITLILWQWRRSGGWPIVRARNHALRSGVLPSGPEPVGWLPALRARERSMSPLVWIYPVLAATQLLLLIDDGTRNPAPIEIALHAMTATAWVGIAAYALVARIRVLPVIRRFIPALEARERSQRAPVS